jgi:hypothetical protein
MPKVSDMYPSRFLKAADADGDLTLTIRSVQPERFGQGSQVEDKWVVYFHEVDKGLVLNKTNMSTIAKLYGDHTDDWAGQRITLYATDVQFQTEMVPALRVRTKPPKSSKDGKPARKDEADADLPF